MVYALSSTHEFVHAILQHSKYYCLCTVIGPVHDVHHQEDVCSGDLPSPSLLWVHRPNNDVTLPFWSHLHQFGLHIDHHFLPSCWFSQFRGQCEGMQCAILRVMTSFSCNRSCHKRRNLFFHTHKCVKVVQLGSFIILIILMTEFCVQFLTMKIVWSQVPTFGGTYTQVCIIPFFLMTKISFFFNFSYLS